jgi:signal-transduction protein with cAMP-binding, CBS, and nucleotidyltransferase domain
MTENALNFKPPLGFFRNFVVESKGRHRNAFDIKSAMTPIVDFARVYALKNKIDETNTIERLDQLRIKKSFLFRNMRSWKRLTAFSCSCGLCGRSPRSWTTI